ncbi:hypothetical protein K0U07_01715 [bacterium]|nr:hypothetical protein [bacterium]
MKKHFLAALIFAFPLCSQSITPPSNSPGKKKMVVFIDINKTSIGTDIVSGKLPEHTLQTDIAEKTIVYETENGVSPFPQEGKKPITLYKWVRKKYSVLKNQIEAFAQVLYLLKEIDHPRYEEMLASYEKSLAILERNFQENQLDIFPSVIKLIQFTCKEEVQEKYDIYIVFRTFGIEGELVASQLNRYFGQTLVDKVRKIDYEGNIEGSTLDPLAFALDQGKRILILRDNYFRWNDHGRTSAYGKPCPVRDGITVKFFDDNAHEEVDAPELGIVAATYEGRTLSTKEAIDAKIVVPISLGDVIQNEDFFINHVMEENLPVEVQ